MAAVVAEAELPNIFFIIGAPTSKTFTKFEEFIDKNSKGTVKLVICADMPTYIKALEGANVFKTPTNFRAHADDVRTFYTDQGDITTNSTEEFQKLQEDIATSLYDIFDKAKKMEIETYFGIVKRENRPTWLNKTKWVKVDEFPDGIEEADNEGKTQFEYEDGTRIIQDPVSVQNESKETFVCEYSPPYKANYFDRELTKKIRDELLIPKVYGNAAKLHEIINNPKISKYGATFLSDMITVACAGLTRKKELWDSYTPIFGDEKTIDAIYSGNSYSIFGRGKKKNLCVKQENLNFEPDPNGTFFGYKEDDHTIDALNKILEAMIDINEEDKMFGNCYVWHDDELNDLDDLPAIELIKKLSNEVEENINYDKAEQLLEQQNELTEKIKADRKAKAEAAKAAKAAKVGEGGRRRSKSGKKKRTKKKRTKKKRTKKKRTTKKNKKNTKKRRSRKNKKRRR